MTTQFPIPPTYTPPFIKNEQTGEEDIDPVWLQWFLDVATVLTVLGAAGAANHNTLAGLQGGTANQYYHLQLSDYNTLLGGGDASALHNHHNLTALGGVTPGASPYVYQNTNTTHDLSLIVQGGTVTKLEYTRDNVTFVDLGVVAGMFTISPLDRIRITYTVTPTLTVVPR